MDISRNIVITTACIAILSLFPACGDDRQVQLDGGLGGDAIGADSGPQPIQGQLLVTTTDFTTSQRAVVDRATGDVTLSTMDNTDQDTVAGPGLTLLARGEGLVHFQSSVAPLISQSTVDVNPEGITTPYASNPVDYIQISSTKGYVISGALNEVIVVDPTAETVTSRIDLSAFLKAEDEDGVVNATGAVRVGNQMFVALGNYWFGGTGIAFAGSEIVVIDLDTDAIIDALPATPEVDAIPLTHENPWRGLVHDAANNRLLVGAAGDGSALDGAIEAVNLTDFSTTAVVTEAALGAELNGFALAADETLWVIVGTDLVTVDADATPISTSLVQSNVVGMILHESVVYTWASPDDGGGLMAFDTTDESDITPGGNVITVGALPVYSVAVAP